MPEKLERIPMAEFWQQLPTAVCLDVRSPGEYAAGHLPGASSFPLFSDAERALVGTAYKQQGAQAALELGLLYVGPKMADFVRQARRLANGRPLLLYCWRGGQRSASMAWLLAQAGLEVRLLEGGYKAWRQWAHATVAQVRSWRVVGGYTGSGKTETLQQLRALGAQVLDLEALAHHKGSAFGAIDQPTQPSNEHFLNQLAATLLAFDPQQPVWIEDESRMIGNIHLPPAMYEQMQLAPCYLLEVSLQRRIERLLAEYGRANSEVLQESFKRIGRKIGGQQVNTALEALAAGDLVTAASIALRYYDRAYELDLKAKKAALVQPVQVVREEALDYAEALLNLAATKA